MTTNPSDLIAVPHSDLELVEYKQHFCRQCNTGWRDIEHQSPTWKHKCLTSCHKYRWWCGALLCILIVVIIVFPLEFRPRPPVGLSRHGAGIVVLDNGDKSDVVDVLFVHASGQIRHGTRNETSGLWKGGTSDDAVLGPYAPQPRQGTPLMAVKYMIGSETTWRVFYIDTSNILQESVGSAPVGGFPNEWSPGTLGLGRFTASVSLHTGLSVCQNMLWSPDPLGFNSGSLALFYGGGDSMNHMLTHEIQDTAWRQNDHIFEDSWSNSGIECTCRGSPILDTWWFNKKGELVQSSFNFDLTSNSSTYPAGKWTSGVVYNQTIQTTETSVSAIKYTGTSSQHGWSTNDTFVYRTTPDNIVTGIVVKIGDRSRGPTTTEDTQAIGGPPVVSGSKFSGVAVISNYQNRSSEESGEDSKIYTNVVNYPKDISIFSGSFYDNSNDFKQIRQPIGS